MHGTAYRAKLPKGWSYTIGAEAISNWLETIDGANPGTLHFSDYHIRNSHSRRLREQDIRYSVLEIKRWADLWEGLG